MCFGFFFFSSRRRHTRCALVTGVQTCALPIFGATLFPHNVGLGAMHDPALMRKIAEATAAEIRVTGQEWTFAPTITVPQDGRWGRAYEGYSRDRKSTRLNSSH